MAGFARISVIPRARQRATLVAIVHHDGRFGLVADDQDPVALGAFLYVVIKTGRWWRGVKPPEPKARRAKE